VVVSRDGGPKITDELRDIVEANIGLRLGGTMPTPEMHMREDGNAIIVDGKTLEKPFVEKPVSGEDHNVYVYFRGGGGRKLFRKVTIPWSDTVSTILTMLRFRLGINRAKWIRI
jgi:inositol hexakisphosphate/diphosphoinositol-pentakisphosphate kinase